MSRTCNKCGVGDLVWLLGSDGERWSLHSEVLRTGEKHSCLADNSNVKAKQARRHREYIPEGKVRAQMKGIRRTLWRALIASPATILGNLGADPETRYTQSGDAVTNLRIATSERWKDKQTGEQREKTEWHRVVFFGRIAEVCAEYLRTGSKVYVEGSLETQQWEKDGEKRYTTQIKGREMQMLDSRGGDSQPAQSGGYKERPRGLLRSVRRCRRAKMSLATRFPSNE